SGGEGRGEGEGSVKKVRPPHRCSDPLTRPSPPRSQCQETSALFGVAGERAWRVGRSLESRTLCGRRSQQPCLVGNARRGVPFLLERFASASRTYITPTRQRGTRPRRGSAGRCFPRWRVGLRFPRWRVGLVCATRTQSALVPPKLDPRGSWQDSRGTKA